LHKLCAKDTCAVSQGVPICGGALMWILAVLEGAYALQEEKLSFRKLAVSARSGCKDGCEGKRSALDQPFADGRANGSTIARHGERPNKIPRVVHINQKEWRAVPSTNDIGGGGEGGGPSGRGNKEIGTGQAAERDVECGVVEPCVWDPFTSELGGEGEVRLNGAPLCDEGGECGREPSNRWVRWAGDEEDPHGGDDGILA
jgi:hypothetical protein